MYNGHRMPLQIKLLSGATSGSAMAPAIVMCLMHAMNEESDLLTASIPGLPSDCSSDAC